MEEMLLICNIYRLKEKKTLLMIINGFIYTFIYNIYVKFWVKIISIDQKMTIITIL